ncbi:TPO protein, partial [Atractosteus spatula]|nr:TPO protein [Atractosteus spatula]
MPPGSLGPELEIPVVFCAVFMSWRKRFFLKIVHVTVERVKSWSVPGFLLPLLCVIAVEVRDIQTSPINFVCSEQARQQLFQKLNDIRRDMSGCSGSALLPSQVCLPFVGLNMEAWKKKTKQVKRSEIVSALAVLLEAMRKAQNDTQSDCLSSLLQRLSHSITNHLLILKTLQVPHTVTLTHTLLHCHTHCYTVETVQQDGGTCIRKTQDLQDVLTQYSLLVRGKMERFVEELAEDICEDRADDPPN